MRRESVARCRNVTTHPSERTYPLPDSSNALHMPSLLSMFSRLNCSDMVGFRMIPQPATIAASQWPAFMSANACESANSELEQAVSTAINDRLVGTLQQHAQLRIHAFRLLLVDFEELRVQVLQVLVLDLADARGQIVEAGGPAAIVIVHHVHALEQVALKLVDVGAFGQPAGEACDADVIPDGGSWCPVGVVFPGQVVHGNAMAAGVSSGHLLEAGRHLGAAFGMTALLADGASFGNVYLGLAVGRFPVRINDRLVGTLQQHAQLRIHAFRLLLVDFEELRVQVLQVLVLDLADARGQIVEAGGPAAIVIVHHVHALEQVALKLVDVGAFGQPAGEACDADVIPDGGSWCPVGVVFPGQVVHGNAMAAGVSSGHLLEAGRHLGAAFGAGSHDPDRVLAQPDRLRCVRLRAYGFVFLELRALASRVFDRCIFVRFASVFSSSSVPPDVTIG
uniref:Uncharacterized protein n=1 Tax=Anopheles atroparvus TaxID=41427 RepID=A0A182IPV8_ANOAO